MLQTDNELDDFKDQMIEVSEEDLIKLSGSGDGDGDGDGDGSKGAVDKASSKAKKAEKKSSENKKDVKKSSQNKQAEKKPIENKKDVKKSSKNKQAEKKSAVGTVVAALIALVVIGGLIAIFIFTGAKNELVGKWEYSLEDSNVRMVFEFTEDGQIEARSYMNNLLNFYDKGTYTAKSGFLKCNWQGQGEVPEVEYKVEGDTLTFVAKGQEFKRIKEDSGNKNASSGDAE